MLTPFIRLLIVILFVSVSCFSQQQLSFPTAEGYGKYTIGGRGGKVIAVTNLNDSGEGSLRAATSAKGPRTVVFKVSGTIDLKSPLNISNPYITIAGQTAPGDGICIKGYPVNIKANQVIIRHLRVRVGDENDQEGDAMFCRYYNNIILDHLSTSWSVDETMSIYHCDSITVQWCIISESMYNSNHGKGTHGFGAMWGGNNSTYHHNLLAHHSSRSPRVVSGSGNCDIKNNVIYNWGYNSCYGGENQQVGDPRFIFTRLNLMGNYYKPGPATERGANRYRIANPSYRDVKTDYGKWYAADNFMEDNDVVSKNNWDGGIQPQGGNDDLVLIKLTEPWASMPINYETPEKAFESVLSRAGAIFPKRDAVDNRIVEDVRTGTAAYEGPAYKINRGTRLLDRSKISGIIDSQQDVGGWPELKTLPALADSDGDGMPDEWELANGLNPNDPTDGNKVTVSGYTALEVYLNSLVGEIIELDFNLSSIDIQKREEPKIYFSSNNELRIESGNQISKLEIFDSFGHLISSHLNPASLINLPAGLNGLLIVKILLDDKCQSIYKTFKI